MKGKPEVLEVLAETLKEELGAANQYIIHAEMCANWGYKTLADLTKRRAIEAMKPAEKLIGRILFLEGRPNLHSLLKIEAGKDVPDQLTIDLKVEQTSILSYKQGIATCHKAGDRGTADPLLTNLQDEQRHAEYFETQLSLVKELGLADFLAQKLEG